MKNPPPSSDQDRLLARLGQRQQLIRLLKRSLTPGAVRVSEQAHADALMFGSERDTRQAG